MMKKIEFSKHAEMKIEMLKNHGILITMETVKDVVTSPDKINRGYKDRLIAQKGLDKEHVLRVVYEERPDSILIINMYPGRRERYEKD
ncbi:DUF4258 domain-containing protein [bacterium]|nr:DUF4258 domain-containing protein [bacterium]